MAQGKSCQERPDQESGGTRNPKRTKGWEETVARPGRQNWNTDPRHETAATTQKRIQQDPQEDPRAEDQETSSWDFQRIADNQELDIVEGSAPSKAEKEAAYGGALATPGVMPPPPGCVGVRVGAG
jgi:hypothetical protein